MLNKRKLIIYSKTQRAELFEGENSIDIFIISTAKNGLGNIEDSNCTPIGKMLIAYKIGGGKNSVSEIKKPIDERIPIEPKDPAPIYTIFEDRLRVGIWNHKGKSAAHVLTRILWLEGLEESNKNTFERYIYLHGTSSEDRLGTPNTHGCIVFSNQDIIKLYRLMSLGDEVEVIA